MSLSDRVKRAATEQEHPSESSTTAREEPTTPKATPRTWSGLSFTGSWSRFRAKEEVKVVVKSTEENTLEDASTPDKLSEDVALVDNARSNVVAPVIR